MVGAWNLQGVESVPQGCWRMLTPMPPSQVGWMSFGWWTILDTHRTLLSVKKNPAALQFLTQTSATGSYFHSPWIVYGTHTQSMSQGLKNDLY